MSEKKEIEAARESLDKLVRYIRPKKNGADRDKVPWNDQKDCNALRLLHEVTQFIVAGTGDEKSVAESLESLRKGSNGYMEPQNMHKFTNFGVYIERIHTLMSGNRTEWFFGDIPLPGLGGGASLKIEPNYRSKDTQLVTLQSDKLGTESSKIAQANFAALVNK